MIETTAPQRINFYLTQRSYLTLAAIPQREIYTDALAIVTQVFEKFSNLATQPSTLRPVVRWHKFLDDLAESLQSELYPLVNRYYLKNLAASFKFLVSQINNSEGGSIYLSADTYKESDVALTVNLKTDLLGDSVDDFLGNYLNGKLTPIIHDLANSLTHELTHLIQFSSGYSSTHTRNKSTIKSEIVFHDDEGNRDKFAESRLRYLSKGVELDAFATTVANDLLHETKQKYGSLVDNSILLKHRAKILFSSYLKNPATIKPTSQKKLHAYWTFLRTGAGDNDTQLAWQRFCKKVYGYLEQA